MNESEFNIIKILVFAFYIFSFLFSFRVARLREIPKYMKRFLLYLFIGGLMAAIYLTTIFFEAKHNMAFFNRVNLISLFFHFVFLSLFIIKIISDHNGGGFRIMYILLLGLSMGLLTAILNDFCYNTSAVSFCLSSFLLVLFCLFYYYNIFHNSPTIMLLEEPSFWIITGIFIGMTLSFPMIIFWDFLDLSLKKPTKRLIQSFANIPYIIMHIFFIKAYLCLLNKPKKLSYL